MLPTEPSAEALANHDPGATVAALTGLAMGTRWTVVCALPAGIDLDGLRAAIDARLRDLVDQMSHWEPSSELCRFNALPAGGWADLSPDFAAVVDLSLRVAHASDGAFDPAIGHLVDLWGFGPPGPQPEPGITAIAEAQSAGGWRRLRRDPAGRRLRQPGGLALDLSGVAKGYAADAIANLLAERAVRHCLVEIGGECVGRGMRPDGDPWWVDLEDPLDTGRPPLRLALHECAVATSGNYVRGDHSLDPRTGRQTTNGAVSVSVVAGTAALADAWATAILVAFPDEELIAAFDIAARILLTSDNSVIEILTPSFERMIVRRRVPVRPLGV